MRTRIVADFETRSRLSVKDTGSIRYAEDPSTDIICLSFKIDGGPVRIWIPVGLARRVFGKTRNFLLRGRLVETGPLPEDLRREIEMGAIVEAHNAGFEFAIWNLVGVKRYGFPRLRPSQMDCTSARASAVGLPAALKNVARVLKLPVQKDMAGNARMQRAARPAYPKKNDPRYHEIPLSDIVWCEDRDVIADTIDYCRNDDVVEALLGEVVPPLSKIERRIWLIDQAANRRGIQIDVPTVKAIIGRLAVLEREAVPRLKRLTRGAVTSIGQVQKIRAWVVSRGIGMDNLQAATIDAVLERDDLPRRVREVLTIRKTLGGAAVKKYKKIMASVRANGRVSDTLLYCGAARTGRWSGRRVQTQNLYRSATSEDSIIGAAVQAIHDGNYPLVELFYGDEPTAYASLTRSVFISAPGKTLYVADYSSVETAALFWIADDKPALRALREGRDYYVVTAGSLFSIDEDDVDGDQRQFGKKVVLGLGYGMGADKFLEQCLDDPRVPELPEDFIRRAVREYRKLHPAVVDLWHDLGKGFLRAVETGQRVDVRPGRLSFRPVRVGALRGVALRLPSGRCLYYWQPRVKMVMKTFEIRDRKGNVIGKEKRPVKEITVASVDPKTSKWVRVKTYGAKLVENAVQALCRDLMAEGLTVIHGLGYDLLWTTHDEPISESETGDIKEYCQAILPRSEWSRGIPLRAAGWTGQRYKKG